MGGAVAVPTSVNAERNCEINGVDHRRLTRVIEVLMLRPRGGTDDAHRRSSRR